MEVLWYLITTDGRYPWNPAGTRRVDYRYLQALAKSIDVLPYSGALLATGAAGGDDVWVLGASLIPHTERMKFLVAVHPSLLSPALLVKMAATFDRFSNGRLLINIVNGDTGFEATGVHLTHDQRYEHCDEFLTIYRRMMAGETVSFEGKYLQVSNAAAVHLPVQQPYPPLWFGGSSEPALEVAAKHVDTYLTWGESLADTAEKIAAVRHRAAAYGRQLRFGIRLNLVVRETEEQAWAAADAMVAHMLPERVAAMQRALSSGDSVGQHRMLGYHGGVIPQRARDLEIGPNLWAGFGLVRPGPGLALVGSPEQVAERLLEYRDLGIESFILSGHPLVEEAYTVADLLLPLLPLDPVGPDAPPSGPDPTFSTFNALLEPTGAT